VGKEATMVRVVREKDEQEINFMLASTFRVEGPLVLMVGDADRIVGAVRLDGVSWVLVHDGELKEKNVFGWVKRTSAS
jgi:hypothetical protein